MKKTQDYLPALRFERLTRLYDPLMRWVFGEEAFRRHLVAQAGILPGMRLLDLGCGTGTLAIQILQMRQPIALIGLDGDRHVLKLAQEKTRRAGVNLALIRADATRLPFAVGSFDRVLSSLVFHHLKDTAKRQAMAEARRVLRVGGELHLVDFGPPRNLWSRILALLMAHLEETMANFQGLLPVMMVKAGFTEVVETACQPTVLGSLSFYRAAKTG